MVDMFLKVMRMKVWKSAGSLASTADSVKTLKNLKRWDSPNVCNHFFDIDATRIFKNTMVNLQTVCWRIYYV